MANISAIQNKNGVSWRVMIRRVDAKLTKTFPTRSAAKAWADLAESAVIERTRDRALRELKSEFKHQLLGLRAFGDDELLSSADLIRAAMPMSAVCGVYFLIEKGEIFYVGKSLDVFGRVMKHRRNGAEFESFSIVQCTPERLDEYEARYIFEQLPRLNKTISLEALRGQKVTTLALVTELA